MIGGPTEATITNWTNLLLTGNESMWSYLREALQRYQVDISQVVLADFHEDDTDEYVGLLATVGGTIYQFALRHSEEHPSTNQFSLTTVPDPSYLERYALVIEHSHRLLHKRRIGQ